MSDQWGDYREAIIILNEESLPLISARGGVINYGFSSIELRVYKSDSRTVTHPLTEPVPANPIPPEPIPQAPAPSDPTPDTVDRNPTVEDVECRSVCSHSSRRSSTSMKSNSELVGEFFDGIDIDAGVASPLSDEADADVTMVDSLADAESHSD